MRSMVQGRVGLALAFILGLAIATAGSATAARIITGKQIQDGSISSKDLSKVLREQLAKAGRAGPRGNTGPRGQTGAAGVAGAAGAKGDTGPSTGPAGGDLAGSYPDPTLRPPELIGIKSQPVPPAASLDCLQVFDTFCGNPAQGYYWNHTTDGNESYLGYYVEPSGFIQFQGAATMVRSDIFQTLIFRLPPGHRPTAGVQFTVPRVDGNHVNVGPQAVLVVNGEGVVYLAADNSQYENTATWDLSTVRFRIGG